MKTILDGGFYYEAPRWHYGRLWFVDCMARTLFSVSPTGDAREHASFDDTPCGRAAHPHHVQEAPACLRGRQARGNAAAQMVVAHRRGGGGYPRRRLAVSRIPAADDSFL